MGLYGKESPRLMWMCFFAIGLLLVLDHAVDEVYAESNKVDSDLVFDNLDQTDLTNNENHPRIARDSAVEEIPLDSSLPVKEHWLSNTVNRIKRSLNNLFSSKKKRSSQKTSKKKFTRQAPEPDDLGQEEDDQEYEEDPDYDDRDNNVEYDEDGEYDDNTGDVENENQNGTLSTDYIAENDDDYPGGNIDDEEYDDDENDYDVENEPNTGEEAVSPTAEYTTTTTTTTEPIDVGSTLPVSRAETSTVTEASQTSYSSTNSEFPVDGGNRYDFSQIVPRGNNNNETHFGDDDEDDIGSSGEGSSDKPVTLPSEPTHPVYYRIIFTIEEPYVDDFKDRNSYKYRDISEELIRAIDNLYDPVPGTQSATVISIEKREADTFKSKVTVDLGSDGYNNYQVIRDVLQNHIESQHRLGKITALPEDFQVRVFDVTLPTSVCDVNQLPCHNGVCVPSESRCNGTAECSDGSDEQGCQQGVPDLPPVHSTTPTSTIKFEPITFAETTTEPVTISGDVGSGDGEVEVASSKCRADDVVRCSDGSRTICADQECDGVENCDDGADEKNCNDCGEGEFGCDVSRCIPSTARCDGVPDCVDSTDETGCGVLCAQGEITCDNKCVPPSRRCDGTADCRDGSDETNCPDKCSPTPNKHKNKVVIPSCGFRALY